MITTRTEKLEQLLTEDCRKALAEIDAVIQEKELRDFHFDQDDSFQIRLMTGLDYQEESMIRDVLELAGWKNVRVHDNHVRFYF